MLDRQTTCERCGEAIPPRNPGAPGVKRRYCSANCRKRACDERHRGTCIDCGAIRGPRTGWRDGDLPNERCQSCHFKREAAAKQARLEDVAEMYREGKTMREIAEALGYGSTSLPPEVTEARKLGLIGVRHLFSGTERREERDRIVTNMWVDGWLARDIADAVGLAPEYIYALALELGLPYRHPGYGAAA